MVSLPSGTKTGCQLVSLLFSRMIGQVHPAQFAKILLTRLARLPGVGVGNRSCAGLLHYEVHDRHCRAENQDGAG